MAKIQTTPKSKFRTNEWYEFCKSIEQRILSEDLDANAFKNEFTTFQAKLTGYETSIYKLSKSEYTLAIALLKRKLSGMVNGLFGHIKSDRSSGNREKAIASNRLMTLVSRFKGIYGLSFNELVGTSMKITSLADLDTFKADIEKLGLTGRIQDINKTIDECKKVMDKKLDESLGRNRIRKTTITRAELYVAYEKLVERLNVCAAYLGDTAFLELFGWWNELIDQHRIIFGLRFGMQQGGKTDSGESAQHDPESGQQQGGEDDRPVIE